MYTECSKSSHYCNVILIDGFQDLPVTKVETRKNGLRITNKKDEEQHFLAKLYKFMKERGTPITKIPSLGFRTGKFVFL